MYIFQFFTEITRNDVNWCVFCKEELFNLKKKLADLLDFRTKKQKEKKTSSLGKK